MVDYYLVKGASDLMRHACVTWRFKVLVYHVINPCPAGSVNVPIKAIEIKCPEVYKIEIAPEIPASNE